jgi:glutamate N-acetyltransferase / amino-acid N-acetyltransferase
MTIGVPKGYRFAGVHCGIKRSASKLDLSLVVSDMPAAAAGVYTQNRVFAAPVAYNRARTPSADMRVIVANSGNANSCTGERGLFDAAAMARAAATTCKVGEDKALVLSTGVIGTFLPMDKITSGITAASGRLSDSHDGLLAAADGILTTDSVRKVAGRQVTLAGRTAQITGMAKGAAMIGPHMATMLAIVLTDAALEPQAAQNALSGVVDQTFNCISVDGHMSTNDTVLLLANGAAGGKRIGLGDSELADFSAGLHEVCTELARAIPSDGEGATHLITLDVHGCATAEAARQIARTIAESPLVKTAIAGADPNWGRIVSAAGYAGIEFNPAAVDLRINDVLLYEGGAPVPFDAAAVSSSIREHRDTHVVLRFGEGDSSTRFWTTDLTAEYVRLNADYHT